MNRDLNDNIYWIVFSVLFVGLGLGIVFLDKHNLKRTDLKNAVNELSLERIDLVNDKNLGGIIGLEFGHAGRVWGNSLNGYSNVYNGQGGLVKTKDANGNLVTLAVKIDGTPTGLIFQEETTPQIFMGDAFVFVTEQGKVFGWHKLASGLEPLTANLRFESKDKNSNFTGITSGKTDSGWEVFIADNANNKILVLDQNYKTHPLSKRETVPFVDTNLPANYSVFNLKNIEGNIYATYKDQTKNTGGVVDIFDLSGKFIKRLITDGQLNSPWGIATTNNTFGAATGNLLIGNLGDGEINMYNKASGEFLGKISDTKGNVLTILGLESLTFGTNNGAGTVNELFFSAKTPDGNGVFGKLALILSDTQPGPAFAGQGTDQEVLTPNEKIEEQFLTESDLTQSYQDFKTNLQKDCLQDCLQEKLDKNLASVNTLYNKIFSDAKIIDGEYSAQNFSATTSQKLDNFLAQLQTLDPQKLKEVSENYCEILANNYFAGDKLIEEKNTCLLYKTEIWLKELYMLRSIFIRVELGPLGVVKQSGKKIQTKAFQNLIDSEEANINKAY